jgi:hypothetical protein
MQLVKCLEVSYQATCCQRFLPYLGKMPKENFKNYAEYSAV